MKRIGLLGGTFNPIHNGHLAVAQVAYEKLRLDKIIFIPSYLPPHKNRKNVLSADYRYNMVALAIKRYSAFKVSSVEIQRKGKSYTIDTLRFLEKKYDCNTKFFFIIGEDSLETLHAWKRIDELLTIATFVAVNRHKLANKDVPFKKKMDLMDILEVSLELKEKIKNVRMLKMPVLDISSNEIRRRIASNKEVQYLMPEEVFKFIKNKNLYK